MAGPKRVPVEVVEKAKTAFTKQYTVATPKKAAATPKPLEKKAKLVAALKRLHPMD